MVPARERPILGNDVIPQWLADENGGYTQGSVPTAFVGQIATTSGEAIQLNDLGYANFTTIDKNLSRIQLDFKTAEPYSVDPLAGAYSTVITSSSSKSRN